MLGNFLGDFVKGSELSYLPDSLQRGIRLHRKVDVYTDQHLEVKQLRALFPGPLKKVAGIALDIYFDYLLYAHWEKYSSNTQQHLFERFYQQLADSSVLLNPRFARVKEGLLSHQWLADYQHEESCLRAFFTIEQRLKGKIKFAQQAYALLGENRQLIEAAFLRFYPDLLSQSKLIVSTHDLIGTSHGN
jgi:acyl carrier protein phosphodiesterase